MVILLAVTLTLTKRLGHLNKVLALVVVADYAIVTRAFCCIIKKTAIVNTTAEIASRTFPIRINQVIHQLDV